MFAALNTSSPAGTTPSNEHLRLQETCLTGTYTSRGVVVTYPQAQRSTESRAHRAEHIKTDLDLSAMVAIEEIEGKTGQRVIVLPDEIHYSGE